MGLASVRQRTKGDHPGQITIDSSNRGSAAGLRGTPSQMTHLSANARKSSMSSCSHGSVWPSSRMNSSSMENSLSSMHTGRQTVGWRRKEGRALSSNMAETTGYQFVRMVSVRFLRGQAKTRAFTIASKHLEGKGWIRYWTVVCMPYCGSTNGLVPGWTVVIQYCSV